MATNSLPRTITKLDLFEEAQKRFQKWFDMYANPDVSEQAMYEDMSCSCYSGNPEDDFPVSGIIRYQYRDGSCYFIIDDIEIEVLDLRSMRKSPRVNKETYVDVCVLAISYTDSNGNYMYHIIPDAWLYGSTTEDFDEGAEVHADFINAAREYIEEHHITKEMQD